MSLIRSLPTALRMIFKDPVNLALTLVPTIVALLIYIFSIVLIFKHSDYVSLMIQNYVPDPGVAGWVGKIITALFIIFIFFLMSWTYVIVVGIIAAPFNSMLSERIEKKLAGNILIQDKTKTFQDVFKGLGKTIGNEFKKLIFIFALTLLALLLNLFPLFYPIGLLLLALLVAVQFVDYSWSRNDIEFGSCLKDVMKNFFPYSMAGFCFLLLVTVPIVNALVPAFATSYFTVLWLDRHNKIKSIEESGRGTKYIEK